MSSRKTTRNSRAGTALAALVSLALGASLTTGSALAMPAEGTVSLTLEEGAVRSLPQAKTSLPITRVDLLGAATVRARGAIKVGSKRRAVRLRGLILQVGGKGTAISAKLGKRRLVFFRAKGKPELGASSLKLARAPLSLTGKGARALRSRLGLDGVSAGKLGTVALDATFAAAAKAADEPKSGEQQPQQPTPTEIVDPYAQQCALKVTSKAEGSAAAPAPGAELDNPVALDGGGVEWGLSGDLRYYIVEISGGSLVPIAPATVLNPPPPAPQIGTFSFPADSGGYEIGDPADAGDDRAVVEGQGTVVLCNSPHGFRVTLSNPTVTIDGDASRLTVDVDTNMSGVWTPSQRVDLATLDLDGASPFYNENARTVTWSDLPLTLTAAGEQALQLCDPHNPGPCDYEEGDQLEPLTVTASTATPVSWPFASACDLASSATASSWPVAPDAPAALPALSTPEALTNGAISWGLRNSLRATVNSNGVFNLSGGATRSDSVSMSGEGKFFTWPATGGEYEAGSPARLVLHGTGSVGLCNTAHGFGTVLANPTIVIDGDKSRLTMDVASRVGTSWTSGRVDIASLATGGMTVVTTPGPGAGEETVTWTFPDPGADNVIGGGDDDKDSVNSSAKLTAAGGAALALISLSTAGTPLNKVTVSIVHPTE
ncbi:MAG TPA: HtaA domain-containing protein [Solirubrobacterales bacterium]|nr:HtaA domain-containing protein [Solirubrobacterales bacterium]